MIFGDNGINWITYYRMDLTEDNKLKMVSSMRLHKYDDEDHPEVDHWIDSWTDKDGKNGVDLKHWRETGEKVRYKRDHINFGGKRVEIVR